MWEVRFKSIFISNVGIFGVFTTFADLTSAYEMVLKLFGIRIAKQVYGLSSTNSEKLQLQIG